MKALELAKRLNSKLFFRTIYDTVNTIEHQKAVLNSFPEPTDDVDRSYYQYKCQTLMKGKFNLLVLNLLSFPVLIYLLVKTVLSCTTTENMESDTGLCVYWSENSGDLIPQQLQDCYRFTRPDMRSISMDRASLAYIWTLIKKHPISWYYLAKCILKLSQLNTIIQRYHPDAILTDEQSSFTSSYLTGYCELKHVRSINIMHGEKVFTISDSFFRFHDCYVWDEHYIRLFLSLRAVATRFVVEKPKQLIFQISETSVPPKYDFVYYLQKEDDIALTKIREHLLRLREKGYAVAYRPHPIYENKNTAVFLKDIEREDSASVGIERSVLQTKYALSRYSTVLYQAYLNGVTAVVDDLTDFSEFEYLLQAGYIMLSLEHKLLSEFL